MLSRNNFLILRTIPFKWHDIFQDYCKVKGLRREIVALQEKCSLRVRCAAQTFL